MDKVNLYKFLDFGNIFHICPEIFDNMEVEDFHNQLDYQNYHLDLKLNQNLYLFYPIDIDKFKKDLNISLGEQNSKSRYVYLYA